MSPRSRILILPAAAVVIFGLCGWRIMNPRQRPDVDWESLGDRRAAPTFELYNQDSKLVQLRSYVNRHPIVLVFFDGSAGPEQNAVLTQLREFHDALEREGYVVFGVSTELPQHIRNASARPFPFDLLSDVNAVQAESVHRQWGRLIEPAASGKSPGTIPGVFLIARSGMVPWIDGAPQPLQDTGQLVRQLLARE